jgi:phage shock protein PspC (stress-responsive transcriptional regulator)
MKNLALVSLSGHSEMFKAEQPAFDALQQYLQRAERSLKSDPDRAEVARDLEQSIGEKIKARLASPDQVLTTADIEAVLAQIGPVDAGNGATQEPEVHGKKPFVRIKEGQNLLGVCNGLAAYADIRVDWLRTIFLLLAVVTGGLFALIYLAMAFFMPVVETRTEYDALKSSD